MKRKLTILFILLIFSLSMVIQSKGLHFGRISAVKSVVKDLKIKVLAGTYKISAVNPPNAAPGTIIEITGNIYPDSAARVKIGNTILPVISQSPDYVTTVIPANETGIKNVSIIYDTFKTNEISIIIDDLSPSTLTKLQLSEKVAEGTLNTISVVSSSSNVAGLYSGSNLTTFDNEMTKLEGVLTVLQGKINELSDTEANLLENLLGNSGLLEIISGSTNISYALPYCPPLDSKNRAVAYSPSEYSRHNIYFKLDVASFFIGNINAVLGPLTIAAAVTPGGQPVAGVLHTIKTVLGLIVNVVDMIIPTDCESISVSISDSNLDINESTVVTFKGDFKAQDNLVSGTIKTFVSIVGTPKVKLKEESTEKIVGYVLDILIKAGIHTIDQITAETLKNLKIPDNDVSIDISLYNLDILPLFDLVFPSWPTKKIRDFLEKVGVDLDDFTLYSPVEIKNSNVASFDVATSKITALNEGNTKLKVRIFKFIKIDAWWNFFGFMGWESVPKDEPKEASFTVSNVVDNLPLISITNPTDSSTVSDTVNVTADASDDKGISKVLFYVDGVCKSADTTSPYSYSWDTTLESEGSHTVKVKAYDTASQTANDQHTVTVDNTAEPHELPDTGQEQSYTTTFGEDHDYQPAASQPSYTDNGDGTITDNRTGLMWVKDGDSAGCNNGSILTWEASLTFCEGLDYAGYSDWRLPNVRELESIVDAGESGPAINTTYFPNTKSSRYWTSTTYVPDTSFAWFVYFIGGSVILYDTKPGSYYVRPVRGSPIGDTHELPDTGQEQSYTITYGEDHDYQPAASQPSYTDNGNGTITDNRTGLMWLKDANNYNSGSAQTWEATLSGCESFIYAGYSDWRLPNKRELMSIVDYGESSPAINTTYFQNTKSSCYWTSTTYVPNTSYAWHVGFSEGHVNGYYNKATYNYYVRPVRAGP